MIRTPTTSDQPVKILLVVPWDEERGGVVAVAENLARYLNERGNAVLFFHPAPTIVVRMKTKKIGFPAGRLRLCFPFAEPRRLVSTVAFVFLFPLILLQLVWFLYAKQIRVVNLHYPINNFFYFAICRRLLRIPLVTSIHGSDVFTEAGKPKAKYSAAFRFLLRSSDLIILPSETYQKRLIDVFPDHKRKTIFIHNGVDLNQFNLAAGPEKSSNNSRYILCVAHLRQLKGIDILLPACTPLLLGDPSLKLMVVGDGPERARLEELASRLKIRNQTQFVGNKQPAEVARLLHGCEIFVLPSRSESFGLVLIEAMACKKPVVATTVGAIPEIIENGKNGLLVEPDNPEALTDALQRLIANDDLKRTLGENGYSLVSQRFCLHRTGAAYETAFASLVSR